MAISQENKKLLTTAGIVVATYLIVIKPLFQSLGITKTDAEIAKEKSDAENINETEKNLNARGLSLSKSKTEWDQIADTIYEDLRYLSFIDDDKDDAGYQLARLKNDADAFYLVKTFGKRQEYLLGLPVGGEKGLIAFVNSNLSQKNIDLINDNYKRKGMNFKL
jgi:hypothetical protein